MKINKVRLIGVLILLIGIACHYFLDKEFRGFWIGAIMGFGIALIITGKIKKVW
ncbi:hypothetical protein [Christiangramia echinicola]|uniref:Lipoprotein n=1 Tax=Christiangramia echinicola TaxID=279359 RepID=A0A1H1LB46_9FLAO|nr:hypothetical protein [Christiangramia echinicola]SDR71590.1 hypothetical protein SAMN04488552_0670 [Christiangramia echinicola]